MLCWLWRNRHHFNALRRFEAVPNSLWYDQHLAFRQIVSPLMTVFQQNQGGSAIENLNKFVTLRMPLPFTKP